MLRMNATMSSIIYLYNSPSFFLVYDVLEDRRTIDVIITKFFLLFLKLWKVFRIKD